MLTNYVFLAWSTFRVRTWRFAFSAIRNIVTRRLLLTSRSWPLTIWRSSTRRRRPSRSWQRATTHSWLLTLSSSRFRVLSARVSTRLASSRLLSLTMTRCRKRLRRFAPPSSSKWRRYVVLVFSAYMCQFQVLCLSVAIGHVEMSQEELVSNISLGVNFLVSLLKKNWQNVRALNVKSSMGKPQRLY